MHPATRAALSSFAWHPWIGVALLLTALVYLRGWRRLHAQMPERFDGPRLAAFLAGLTVLYLAVASPLDAFAGLLLSVHMIQHLLLTMVVAPLLLLGLPQIPLLRGLPAPFARGALGPFLAAPEVRALGRALSHPVVALLSFVAATWLWHLPALYELALRAPGWHAFEHACFLFTALLFWWPVVAPWPSVPVWPRWAVLPYLLGADLANTALSALFSFSDGVIYPTYATAPRLGGTSALGDQSAAGALMWVLGAVAYLVPAAAIAVRLLSPPLARPGEAPSAGRDDAALASLRALSARRRREPLDLLRLPLLGALLRRPGLPRAMRCIMFALAALVVADGLLGPRMAPMNLAGVLPWTYWRGLLVVTLLAAGNWFCMACPFLLPRELGRRFLPARHRWPRALRSKWLAVAILLAYLCAYEAAGLWSSPFATACVVLGYFVAAFAVDGLFRGASFCKYVCPIGQFNFVTATLAPLEVSVKHLDTCGSCTTQDCIRGNAERRGCELDLYLPQKAGNLDCTFCLDCLHACPHDNVGILAVTPALDLTRDPRRSSIGRLSFRTDVATLALVLVFAAFANAAAMVGPVVAWQDALATALGVPHGPLTVALLLLAMLALPVTVATACALVGRALARTGAGTRELFCRFSLGLIPLGAGMWLAHFAFHFATGSAALLPVLQRAAASVGVAALGTPSWSMAAPAGALPWLLPLLLLVLDVGLLLTLWLVWRIGASYRIAPARAAALIAPWSGLACALYVAAVWILLQPMEMRGTMVH
jgi:cytochrome c oxidase assembly factor CtaG